MKYTHKILLATDCPVTALMNKQAANKLLGALEPTMNVLEKQVIARENGLVAYYISEHEHLILTTNPQLREAFLDMRSRRPIEENKLVDALQEFSQTHFTNISLREFTNNDYAHLQCQEAHCRYEATKDYHGLKLCADHYEQWLEREDQRRQMREWS